MSRKFVLVFILMFVAGGVVGYTLNRWMQMSPGDFSSPAAARPSENPPAVLPEEHIGAGENARSEESGSFTSAALLETVLPNRSPAWAAVDLRKIRNHRHRFDEVLQLPSIQKVIQDFCSTFPQGATETFRYFYDRTDLVELFLLPPESESPEWRFVGAFRYSSPEDEEEPQHPLFSFWENRLDEAETSEEIINGISVYSIKTPIGVYAGIVTENRVWFSNHLPGLTALLTRPFQPQGEEKNPRLAVSERYPEAAVTLYFNAADETAGQLGMPGMVPILLNRYGVKAAMIAYQLLDDGVRVSVQAPAARLPEWVERWSAVTVYPFTREDPMGLVELAFAMPILDATVTPESVQPEMIREVQPGNEVQLKTALTRPKAQTGISAQKNKGKKHASTASTTVFQWFPQGAVSGVNVFGYYQGQPALALRFSESGGMPGWLQKISTAEDIAEKRIEIDRIPALHYQFKHSPIAEWSGRNEIVVLERDAVTYVFDSPVAGKNYFGELNSDPSGKTRRSPAARDGLEQVEPNAQIKGVLSKDWFSQWLESELKHLKRSPVLYQEIRQLRDDIQPHLQDIHFSAGRRGQEWFLDSHAHTAGGHLLDLFLLSTMLERFMNE